MNAALGTVAECDHVTDVTGGMGRAGHGMSASPAKLGHGVAWGLLPYAWGIRPCFPPYPCPAPDTDTDIDPTRPPL